MNWGDFFFMLKTQEEKLEIVLRLSGEIAEFALPRLSRDPVTWYTENTTVLRKDICYDISTERRRIWRRKINRANVF